MNIKLKLVNHAYHFEAVNEQGNTVNLDANPAIGGENMGFRPMETLLAGLGGCSAIDILSILRKQQEVIDDFKIEINATRREQEVPAIFEQINIQFIVKGKVDEEKLKRALKLTFEKYCSVANILGRSATINFSYILN